jgi:hypothetical protein
MSEPGVFNVRIPGDPAWVHLRQRRLLIPYPVNATATGGGLPCDVEFVLDVDDEHNPSCIVCTEFTMRRRAGAEPVTATTMRKVPVRRLVELALGRVAVPDHIEPEPELIYGPDEVADALRSRRGHRGRPRSIADSELARIAKLYRDNPEDGTQAVAEEFKVHPRTARRYVKRAEEAGYSIKPRKRKR